MERSSNQRNITFGIALCHLILHWFLLGTLSKVQAQPHDLLIRNVANEFDEIIKFSFDAQDESSVQLFQMDSLLGVEWGSRPLEPPEANADLDTIFVAHELGSHC